MIRTKSQFYTAWIRGDFGNRLEVWFDPHTALSQYNGYFCIRSLIPGGPCRYDIPAGQLVEAWQHWPCRGIISRMLGFNESVVCQGEFIETERGLALFYSTIDKPMRVALSLAGQHVFGLRALAVLRYYVEPTSFDDMMELLSLYPGHVIEFSTYNKNVGICSHRRTVIWEVREY